MRLLPRVAIAALFFGTFSSQDITTSSAQSRLQTVDSTLQVCIDQKTSKPLAGDIELMLVMDNSKSLKRNDPDGKRFLQVRTLLKSVHDQISKSRKPRAVRFSLITFANRAIAEIPLASAVVLSDGNLDSVGNEVESAAPGDQFNTDYVVAIDKALDEMKDAPKENCRVIVWFTDGGYFPYGGTQNSLEGGVLRKSVCEPGGFSETIRRLNINIFPLYIESEMPDVKEDPTASRDVMAHLTGDQNSFGADPYQPGTPCETQQSHIGEVLNASDVNQLGQFFADLPNIIEGGIPVACPTKDGQVESNPLPAGRYVSRISIVKYVVEGKELSPSDLVARQPDGSEKSLDNYYSGQNGRYEAKDNAIELQSGWIITGSGEEHCIRAFAREGLAVQIRKSGNTPEIIPFGSSAKWLAGEDLVSSNEDSVVPIVRLGKDANCKTRVGFPTDVSGLDKAFETLSGQGRGVICVDPKDSEVFLLGVSIDVAREGQPLISCDAITIDRAGAREYVRGDRTEQSTTCEIDFYGSGTKFDSVITSFSELFSPSSEASFCNIDFQNSVINAENKNEVVSLSLSMVLKENRATKCNIANGKLKFNYKDTNGKAQSGEIATSIVLDLQPEPNRRKALIATLLTVIALLALALALLRRMTVRSAALTPAGKLLAVRVAAQASRSVDGRVKLTVENQLLRDLRLDMERVERAKVEGGDSKLIFKDQSDEIVVYREMPPLPLMLREPWARVDDIRPYVVHPKGRHAPANQNLNAPFRDAIIALDEGLVKGSKSERSISIWVIQSKGASGGDQVAIEENLKENGQALIDDLLDHLEIDTEGEGGDEDKGSTAGNPPSPDHKPKSDTGAIPPPPDWS